ncbi:hypothetical protein ALC57_16499, partial [Trachymyrmex cornetzi]
RELLEKCGHVATLVECFALMQRCDECIEQLEELCRTKRAVINYNHIEPRRFLEDGGNVVLERVRDAVERHCSVKMNTAFNGDFATKDKRANKSIITKNNEIYYVFTILTRAKNCRRTIWIVKKRDLSSRTMDILPMTKEKYISFTKHVDSTKDKNENHFLKNCVKLTFIDSYKFLASSLEKLASYLDKDKLKIMYYDVNNLYGWAMCKPLPYAEFRWVEDAANFDVSAIAQDSPTGYILEVDLEYPQHLHYRNADLPFCTTRDKPLGKREDKLLATLYDKQRYVIHYRNLQERTRHELRVTKIHRVLKFAQSPWFRDYIELNTHFRTRAKNDSEKNLYKLIVTSWGACVRMPLGRGVGSSDDGSA